MKKTIFCWLLLLSLFAARAESFWTLNDDPYYHRNPACDDGEKLAISEEAAVVFGKTACPLCVKELQPVYTGEALPDWPFECGMWEISWTLSLDQRPVMPDSYREAWIAADAAFESRHAEIYDPATQSFVLAEPYPDYYAGRYRNCSGSTTYLMVDPTEEKLRDFTERYGAGVWIVPAKYSYAELQEAHNRLWDEIKTWTEQSDLGVMLTSMGVSDLDNVLEIGLYGVNWQLAAAQMDLPVFARVVESAPATTDSF